MDGYFGLPRPDRNPALGSLGKEKKEDGVESTNWVLVRKAASSAKPFRVSVVFA